MNKTTEKFIEEFKDAIKRENPEEINAYIEYLKFDYRIDIQDLKKHLTPKEIKIIEQAKENKFDFDEYLICKITDEYADLIYQWLNSKNGEKIINKLKKRILKELIEKNIPSAFWKREIDRILGYSITYKTIFSKTIGNFLSYLSKRGIL